MSTTLAARKSRSRKAKDSSPPAISRDDVSPTRKKELKGGAKQSGPLRIVLVLFLLIIMAYYYHTSAIEERPGRVVVQSGIAISKSLSTSISLKKNKDQPLRFVSIILPSVVAPKQRRRRLETIAETWGPSSRAIYVIHNQEEEFPNPPPAGEYPQILQVPTNITFNDGLPRLYYVIRSVYRDWNAEFYFFANDHTYIIPEHLCYYLKDADPNSDMYAGHALKNDREAFNSGAAGYVLTRNTMRRLIESWDAEKEHCVTKGDKWLQGNPGLVTAKCLHHTLGVQAVDTREAGKYHRFHAFGLVRMTMGKVDNWYTNKHMKLLDFPGFDESYTTLLKGADCCSAETISFHYVEWVENKCLFEVRQALLQNPAMTDSELQQLILQTYPKEWKELGGYSRLLPKPDEDKESWDAFFAVFRKLSLKQYEMKC